MKVATYFTTIMLIGSFSKSKASEAENRLIRDLFEEYIPASRPARNDLDTVNVTLGFTLSQIIDVHEKNQILVLSAFIRQIWKNPILEWEPIKYNNIKEINVDPAKIWKPDIVLYNNADEDKTFGGNLDRLNTRAILKYDGTTTWLAPIILKSQCPIDVTHFPFDTQICKLKFGSWTYDKARLNLLKEKSGIDLSKYSTNSEWKLVGNITTRNELQYTCCPGYFQDVTFTLIIARRSLFYLCNLIFPMIVIGMLTILSFVLPAESGERISLAITLLLAMTVFMLVVADIIPATSDVIPLVGIFFSASMVEMVIMIIVLCYIMRLHHKSATDPPMPLWMRRFVLEWLSYKVFIRRHEKVSEEAKTSSNKSASDPFLPNGGVFNKQQKHQMLMNNLDLKLIRSYQENTLITWDQNKGDLSLYQNESNKKNEYAFPPREMTEADMLLRKVDAIVDKLNDADEETRIKTEWRIVAMTIDRCLLIVFALLVIVTLFGCFSRSPGYVS